MSHLHVSSLCECSEAVATSHRPCKAQRLPGISKTILRQPHNTYMRLFKPLDHLAIVDQTSQL